MGLNTFGQFKNTLFICAYMLIISIIIFHIYVFQFRFCDFSTFELPFIYKNGLPSYAESFFILAYGIFHLITLVCFALKKTIGWILTLMLFTYPLYEIISCWKSVGAFSPAIFDILTSFSYSNPNTSADIYSETFYCCILSSALLFIPVVRDKYKIKKEQQLIAITLSIAVVIIRGLLIF